MATISLNLEHLGPNFALHSGTTEDTCVQNIKRISENWGARSGTKISVHILDPNATAAAASKTNKKHIRATLFMWDLIIMCAYNKFHKS